MVASIYQITVIKELTLVILGKFHFKLKNYAVRLLPVRNRCAGTWEMEQQYNNVEKNICND